MRLKPVVLSIDDDITFRTAIDLVLSRLGLQVKGVSTPDEFIDAAKKLKPDLYLIDLQLTDSSGLELLKMVRSGALPEGFVVIISSNNDPATLVHALELGAADFIMKPVDKTLLATKVAQFFETEELKENRAKWHAVQEGRARARLQFEGTIEGVDELGIKFSTVALVPKGTVLKVSSQLFGDIGTQYKECLVTVTSTWLISETRRYGAYAEFDGVDLDFLQAIRRWLTS